jgi:hypothetical protein
MFFFLYKTTNLLNGKYYVGIHRTFVLEDGYLGSGKHLLASIRKYGKANFLREIIEFFPDEETMIARELEVVDATFVKKEENYNIAVGGNLGSAERNGLSFKGRQHSAETKKLIAIKATSRVFDEATKNNLRSNSWAKKNPVQQKISASNAGSLGGKAKKNLLSATLLAEKKYRAKLLGLKNKGKELKEVICPHCLIVGKGSAMARWHFSNCKSVGV